MRKFVHIDRWDVQQPSRNSFLLMKTIPQEPYKVIKYNYLYDFKNKKWNEPMIIEESAKEIVVDNKRKIERIYDILALLENTDPEQFKSVKIENINWDGKITGQFIKFVIPEKENIEWHLVIRNNILMQMGCDIENNGMVKTEAYIYVEEIKRDFPHLEKIKEWFYKKSKYRVKFLF